MAVKTVIRVSDFNSSIHFYNNILNFSIIETWNEVDAKGCILQIEEASFIEVQKIYGGNKRYHSTYNEKIPGNKIELQIRTHDVANWANILKKASWPFLGPEKKTWGAEYLYIKDPDGFSIVFYQETT
jgi:catechol-2,3-dioxygenase